MIVLGLAVLISVLGTVGAVAGGRPQAGSAVGGLGAAVPGMKLRALPASSVLRHIATGGEPPANVVRALTVPAGSSYTGSDRSPSLDQFDRAVGLSVPAPGSEVVRFYETELSRGTWVLESATSPRKGVHELLAQHPGTDGYEWLVGITITDQSPTVSPALAGSGQSSASCTVRIRLEQQGEGD